MVDKEQQIKNLFIYLLPLVFGNLLPFITVPIFTRILTPDDYGVLALANIYSVFISGVSGFGMITGFNRNYFQYQDNQIKNSQLLYSTILFVLINFIFLLSITFLFRNYLSKLIIGSDQYGVLLTLVVCANFFNNSANGFYFAYYKNSESAENFVRYTILGKVVYLVVSIFLVAYLRIGIVGIVYAQICSGVMLFGLLSYKFLIILTPSLSKSVLIESIKISYPLLPRIFLGVINTQADKYMIGLLNSRGGAGIYSIGQNFSYLVFSYMTAIQNVFSPQVYKRMFELKEDGGRAIGKYLTPFAYVSIIAAFFGIYFFRRDNKIVDPSLLSFGY